MKWPYHQTNASSLSSIHAWDGMGWFENQELSHII